MGERMSGAGDEPAPEAFWARVAIGMGGYIGGRSLEKVAGAVASAAERKGLPRKPD